MKSGRPAFALGALRSTCTTAVSVAWQPVATSVTVSVYVAATVADGVGAVGLERPAPVPASVAVPVVQSTTTSGPASATGRRASSVMTTVSAPRQPVKTSVTVSVYVVPMVVVVMNAVGLATPAVGDHEAV